MSTNFLEELLAEWYEYKGYFVRKNVNVGKRAKGGYECELDIVAFNPSTKHLVHIEPSMDADSWAVREVRYKKKFDIGKKHIPGIFNGLDLPTEIDQIALLVFASAENHSTLGGGKVITIHSLLNDIFLEVKTKHLSKDAIPEQWVILRSFQFVAEYKNIVQMALQNGH